MKKIFITCLITALCYSFSYAEKAITITDECVYLDELTAPHIAHTKVTCGLAPGETKVFAKELITSYLNREGIKAKVLDDMRVTRQGVELPAENILAAVNEYFKAAYPDYTFEISQLRAPKDLYAKDITDFSLSVNTDKFGSSYVEINNGQRRVNAYLFVKAFKEGYVSTAKIMTGEMIAPKAKLEKIEVTNLRGRLLDNLENLVASKSILQGKPILADIANAKPENIKGDSIKLIISTGQIKLQTIGILEENAYKGKIVMVKNKDTQKIISARYIGGGVAEADF